MLVVKLMGGFGNQMFQYAFARALKEATGEDVFFDLTYFDEIKKQDVNGTGRDVNGVSIREYEINIFENATIKIATNEHIEKAKNINMPKFFYKFLKMLKLTGYTSLPREKSAFSYHREFLNLKNAYFEGYFQNEKYLNPLKNILIKEFELPKIKEDDEYNKNNLKKIEETENSVFIHVRREDYLSLGMAINENYYKRAVEYIKQKVENPKFFVFCAEDPEYIKNNFDIGAEFELIGTQNKTRKTYFENMRLMMACKHAILANSSYSWWSAYLSDFEGKIVVAPSPWLEGSDEVICKKWVKISSK